MIPDHRITNFNYPYQASAQEIPNSKHQIPIYILFLDFGICNLVLNSKLETRNTELVESESSIEHL